MMKTAAGSALLVTLLAGSAEAACPNACSGHGTCGQYDACSCYPDYGGGDCSQRFCPSNFAWVTTSNGDLNADGDRDDFTIYDADHYFKQAGLDYIVSQNEPQGTWENWPAYATAGEGHFYMECSNMGICDRSTGQCQCFEGYSGAGCRRSNCPSDCSGHGVCKTVSQQKGGFEYDLWDKDMSRSCVCDAGYSGPDCSERKCALGDDPLITGKVNEKQWVDIYTNLDGTVDMAFSGNVRLIYTDYNGVEWTTDPIAVAPFDGTNGGDIETAVETALNGLPDDVLSEVTVAATWVQKVIPGTFDVTASSPDLKPSTGAAGATYVLVDGTPVRCESETLTSNGVLLATGGGPASYPTKNYAGGDAGLLSGDESGVTCYEVPHYWSLRLEVSFGATPGDLTELQVDVSELISNGKTNALHGSEIISGEVSDIIPIVVHHGTGGGTLIYTKDLTDTSLSGIDSGSKTLTVSTATISNTELYFVRSRVTVECDSKMLGTFTIASVDTASDQFKVEENIPACTSPTSVTRADHFIETNADYTGLLGPGDILTLNEDDWTSATIEEVLWDTDTGKGHIRITAASSDQSTTDPGNDSIAQRGKATSEKEECSGRGLCDRETGICTCFKGYTGWACSTQNALSL